EIIDFLADMDGAEKTEGTEYLDRIRSQNDVIEKDHKIMMAMYRWLQLINEGRNPSDFFVRHGYHHVAIYGLGMLGKILRTGLLRKQIAVSYTIDQNPAMEESDVINWKDEWKPVDCIVVTPFYEYETIKKRIRLEKGNFRVISLEDILLDTEYKREFM
ncbi:MAG TPA: hypothetical protein DF613_07745, partial [Lachnospiraceae bacterium]|nr:hypothetical protein [Lachnospiraceae bacterium]